MNGPLRMPIDESADRLLQDRREYVYPVGLDRAERFAEIIANYLEPDPYGRHPLDDSAPHYVTTLYFDSDDHQIARACERGGKNVKLRAREYSQLSKDSGVFHRPQLWFEVKTRLGARTRKKRFSIPSHQVGDFFRGGAITNGTIAIHRQRWGESAEIVFEEIAELHREMQAPLRPVCLAHYRRRAWQSQSGAVRVTLDTELDFYRAPPAMFEDFLTLNQAVTGFPITRAEHCVIEIKLHDGVPSWLRVLLHECGVEVDLQQGADPYSKFLAATRAVANSTDNSPPAKST